MGSSARDPDTLANLPPLSGNRWEDGKGHWRTLTMVPRHRVGNQSKLRDVKDEVICSAARSCFAVYTCGAKVCRY